MAPMYCVYSGIVFGLDILTSFFIPKVRGQTKMDMKQFQSKLKNKIVLVDFSASWCAPCKAMAPIVKGMIKTYAGKASLIEINIDAQRTLATDYMVQSIPTLIIFNDGREVKRLVGLQPAEIIEQSLNNVMGNDTQ